jgi:erythromycin esterase
MIVIVNQKHLLKHHFFRQFPFIASVKRFFILKITAMRYKIALLLFLSFSTTAFSQKNNTVMAEWLKKNIHVLKTDSAGDFADLQFLKTVLKDKRVVLLGESSHGIGDYYSYKSRLVEFLYREMGFEVIAMESGIADIYLKYRQTDSISARQLRNETVFGNFHCAEIMPLFNLIKKTHGTTRPLLYAGFDSQNFAYLPGYLRKILSFYDTARANRIYRDIFKYYNVRNYLWQQDKQPLYRLSDTVIAAAQEALQLITEKETEIKNRYRLTSTGMAIIKRAIANYSQSMQINWHTDNPPEKRDSLMAENFYWLMDSLYPGKKVIIWAHNAHIGITSPHGNPYKWMGEWLRGRYGKQTYHIGLFAQSGSTYEWWTKSIKPFNRQSAGDLEYILSLSGAGNSFLELSGQKETKKNTWLFKPVTAFEVENGGEVRFVPVKRFDGLIFFKNVKPPQYDY